MLCATTKQRRSACNTTGCAGVEVSGAHVARAHVAPERLFWQRVALHSRVRRLRQSP